MSYEGQISGPEPNSQAPCILDWEKHRWPNDCQSSLEESLWVESSRVGKVTVEIACLNFLLVYSLGFLVELKAVAGEMCFIYYMVLSPCLLTCW